MYRAVVKGQKGQLRATALAGMHSVLLGFDHPPLPDLLGFAIHRTDRTNDESSWLKGQIKREELTDKLKVLDEDATKGLVDQIAGGKAP